MDNISRYLVIGGLVLIVLGGLFWLGGRIGLPLGRLPGDIRIDGNGGTFYFPLATSILISVVLTVVLNLIARFWNK
jgi:hypothetical protein